MNRHELDGMLQSYKTDFPEEQKFIPLFRELLSSKDCFQRTHLPGHITGSAWIVNSTRTKTLLVHHAKLNKWVQPGGHADGEEDVLSVALREAEEETGLKGLRTIAGIFDVDVHLIPERRDFPKHFHYDIRFLVEGDETESIAISEESHDVRWIDLNALERFTSERSVLRMKDKLAHTHSPNG
jgi:8-oxo-dGTP pyrophosphatase MutT (NUDIX family)